MQVGAPRKEQRGDTGLIAIDCTPERRVSKAVSHLDSRAAIQQGLSDLYVASPGCHVQRGAVFHAIAGVHACAGLNQCAHYVCTTTLLALVGHAIQWSVTTGIGSVGLGAKTQKQLYCGHITRGCGPVQ